MKFMVICIFAALLCFSAPLVAASADAVQAPEIDKDLVLYFNTIDASGDNSLSADELSVFFTKTFGHKVSANQVRLLDFSTAAFLRFSDLPFKSIATDS